MRENLLLIAIALFFVRCNQDKWSRCNYADQKTSEAINQIGYRQQDAKKGGYFDSITCQSSTYPVWVKFNDDNVPGDSVLRRVDVKLQTLSANKGEVGYEPVAENELSAIYEKYHSSYGNPDSSEIDSANLNLPVFAAWHEGNIRIEFRRGTQNKTARGNVYGYQSSSFIADIPCIVYKRADYKEYLIAADKKIRSRLDLNSVVSAAVDNPSWQPYKDEFGLNGLALTIRPLELKRIDGVFTEDFGIIGCLQEKMNAVRFDAILLDQFNNELLRVPNITLEIPGGLAAKQTIRYGSNPGVPGFAWHPGITWNIPSYSGTLLKKCMAAENYQKSYNTKIKVDLKSASFTNDVVLSH